MPISQSKSNNQDEQKTVNINDNQAKYVWKQTKHDEILPFKKYNKAHRLQGDGPH